MVFYVVETELVGKHMHRILRWIYWIGGACSSEMGGVIKFSLLFEVLRKSSTGKCLHASHERWNPDSCKAKADGRMSGSGIQQ